MPDKVESQRQSVKHLQNILGRMKAEGFDVEIYKGSPIKGHTLPYVKITIVGIWVTGMTAGDEESFSNQTLSLSDQM